MARAFLPELWIAALKNRSRDAAPVIRCHDVAPRMSLTDPAPAKDS